MIVVDPLVPIRPFRRMKAVIQRIIVQNGSIISKQQKIISIPPPPFPIDRGFASTRVGLP
jgi:hypothetical protein